MAYWMQTKAFRGDWHWLEGADGHNHTMLTLTSSMDSQIHPPAISTKWNRCVWESFISSSWLRTCLHMAMNGLCQSILY